MKYISLLDASKLSSINTHKTVLIKTIIDIDGEDEEFTWGHCHIEKSNNTLPKYIYEKDIVMYQDDIVAITKY